MKSIELFAGSGGLALGLELAGFNHIGLVENDINAVNTLLANRPKWNVINDDITLVCQKNLLKLFQLKKGELDLLSGGSPCQAFSYAGKRLGLNDTRGTLFYCYASFLKALQPKIFLFENVEGLISHDNGKTFKTICKVFKEQGYEICKVFKEQGYEIKYQILNAWDYNVPQKRERLILIGIRNNLTKKIKFNFPSKQKYKPVIKDILLDSNPNEKECARYSKQKENIFALVPPGGYWKDIPTNIAKQYMKSCWFNGGGRTGILRRISLNEPSLTILTSPCMKQTDRCHPIENRPFSYRENARIQTFPDEWIFCGKLNEKYKQIGNAVPVNLAKAIGIELMNMLKLKDKYEQI